MKDNSNHSIEPFINQAQDALNEAMSEACRVDLRKADTGELIRVEEALQSASTAAKEVVSLRLKRRNEREQGQQPPVPSPRAPVQEVEEHRIVRDETGTTWAVVAVHPSNRSVDQKTLPEKFAGGWLLFEHGDVVRRYAPIPENWQALSDADLRFLCQHAEVATKRITPLRSAEEKVDR